MSAFYDLSKTTRSILNQAIVRSIVSENNGALFDPSDLSTLYQDAAGTTPVTAVEQPVGLMLDKAQGGMLGPELVSNGSFDSAAGWNVDATGFTVSNGVLSTNATTNNITSQTGFSFSAGKVYKLTVTLTQYTRGAPRVSIGGNVIDVPGNLGTFTAYVKATNNATILYIYAGYNGSGGAWSISDISIKELYGYHATQSITASRPTLSARYNLLTKTEDFSDAAWVSSGCSAVKNYGVSPIGTITSSLITNSWVGGYFSQTDGVVGANKTLTAYIKNSSTGWVRIAIASLVSGANGAGYFINTTTGAKGSAFTGGTGYSVVSCASEMQADGWVKVVLTVAGASEVQRPVFNIAQSNGDPSGPIGATVQLWGFDLRLGTASGPYQRVNTSTDYDTNERYFKKYLRFDGVDDYLNLPYMGLYANGSASVIFCLDDRTQAGNARAFSESSATTSSQYSLRNITSGGFDSYIADDAGASFVDSLNTKGVESKNYIISVIDSGLNVTRYRNSTYENTQAYSRAGKAFTANKTTIGALDTMNTVVAYTAMNLYGLIITKSALTDAQRVACERYLGRKSGVQL